MSVEAAFTGIGRFCVRFRWLITVAWIVATVAAVTQLPALSTVTQSNNSKFLPSSAPSMHASDLAAPFGTANYVPVPVVAARDGSGLTQSDEQALTNAMTQWPNGGMRFPKQDIRSPFDFAQIATLVRAEDFAGRMLISADPDAHRQEIQKYLDLGVDRIYIHNVGRNQAEWIEVFGREVLPKLVS